MSFIAVATVLVFLLVHSRATLLYRAFQCDHDGRCVQQPTGSLNGTSLEACAIACGSCGYVWPKPRNCHMAYATQSIRWPYPFLFPNMSRQTQPAVELFKTMSELFMMDVASVAEKSIIKHGLRMSAGENVAVGVHVEDWTVDRLRLDTDETYRLNIFCGHTAGNGDNVVKVKIDAETVFGARHALETLHQLIAFDHVSETMKISCDVAIEDGPAYKYRGVLLDTSRQFYPLEYLRHLIDSMSYSKLNRLHWHISDFNSFPLQIQAYPEMTLYGAYSPEEVYLQEDVRKMVQHAKARGVAIVPEIDAPGHVGFGWDWQKERALNEPLVLCMDQRCISVPCAVLNIASSDLYEVLKTIYQEIFQLFEQPEIFHMGGDELNFTCWKNDYNVRQFMSSKLGLNPNKNESYFEAWADFQTKAFASLRNGVPSGTDVFAALWSSNLTNDHLDILLKHESSEDYVVEVWEETTSKVILELLKHNVKVILANSDAWYLDCGFGNWVGEAPNWCSPYKTWQRIYNHRLDYDVINGSWHVTDAKLRRLILGGELAMWSEEADSASADSKIWPRAAAFAERLWSNPKACWIDGDTTDRMLLHRERMVQRGVRADALNPKSCLYTGAKSCYAQVNEWKKMKIANLTTCIQYRPKPSPSVGDQPKKSDTQFATFSIYIVTNCTVHSGFNVLIL